MNEVIFFEGTILYIDRLKMTANNRHSAPGKPSLIEHRGMNVKFLIVNRPAQATLPQFIKVSSLMMQALVFPVYSVLLKQ